MWLLDQSTYAKLLHAYTSGAPISVEQQQEFVAASLGASADGGRILSIAGDTAEITIAGVLTKTPDFFAKVFGNGNTTYAELISALATADADADVKKVILNVDSPGGTVDGMFEALEALEAFSKPLTARVANLAASAAFAIVSQADSIEATNPLARFGSVGVAADFFVSDHEVSVTSTDAPKKRPDLKTEEGQAVVREQLDAIHEVFVESIAAGRNTTVKKVNANFGQGATVLATEAKSRGMIDSIAKTSLKSAPTKSKSSPEATNMDLQTLKADHPATYAAAVALGDEQGATRALATERDRVGAFVVAGQASGDMKTAMTAIADGSEMTATLQTTFMMATANRRDLSDRGDDDDSAAAALAAADAGADDAGSEAEQVLALVQASAGLPA